MKKIFLLSFLLLAGCMPSGFNIYKRDPDQFHPNALATYYTSPISIMHQSLLGFSYGEFRIYCFRSKINNSWAFRTQIRTSDWMFVEKILFRVDDEVITLTSEGSPDRSTEILADNVYCNEGNWFDITETDMAKLSKAKAIAMRLEGRSTYMDKTLLPEDIADISKMYWHIMSIAN